MTKDERLEKCEKTGLSSYSCLKLIRAINNLDEENDRIWSLSNVKTEFPPDSKNYHKLDKAYTTVQDAMGWLRDIIGDVD